MRVSLITAFVIAVGVSGCGKKERSASEEASRPGQQPITLEELAAEFGIELAQLEEDERFRSGTKRPSFEPLYPRGDVRVADLDKFRADVTADFAGGGAIEFRIRKRVLHQAPFEPDEFATIQAIPDEVCAAVKEGETVTWGFYPAKGRPVTTQFSMVKEDPRLQKQIKKLTQRLAGADPFLLTTMRAQLYLNKRLYYPAYRDAREAAHMGDEDVSHPYAIMQASLRRMKLHKSALWEEIQGDLAGVKGRFAGGAHAR